MADPTPYIPSYSYSGWQASNPTRPLPAQRVDNDFANIATTTTETINALKDIRRSDGALKNGIVTPDSLSDDVSFARAEDAAERAEAAADEVEAGLLDFGNFSVDQDFTPSFTGAAAYQIRAALERAVDVRMFGAVGYTTYGAIVVDSTVAINEAAAQAVARGVPLYIPPLAFGVTQVTFPSRLEVIGVPCRQTLGEPTTGSRLYQANDALTGVFVACEARAIVSGVAFRGRNRLQTGIRGASQVLLDRCNVFGFATGVDGDYSSTHLTNSYLHENTDGTRNFVDGLIADNIINANLGNGISQQAGASATRIMRNKSEFNDGANISLAGSVGAPAANNIVSGNVLDRAGLANVRASYTQACVISENLMLRSGRLAELDELNDTQFRFENNDRLVVSGNITKIGQNDESNPDPGYTSPKHFMTGGANTSVYIEGGVCSGFTMLFRRDGVSGVYFNGSTEHPLQFGEQSGQAVISRNAALVSIATATSADFVLDGLAILAANSVGRVYEVGVIARNASTGAHRSAELHLRVSRSGASAAVSVAKVTNIEGTDFATTATALVVTASVNADGTSITLNIANTSGATQQIHVTNHRAFA